MIMLNWQTCYKRCHSSIQNTTVVQLSMTLARLEKYRVRFLPISSFRRNKILVETKCNSRFILISSETESRYSKMKSDSVKKNKIQITSKQTEKHNNSKRYHHSAGMYNHVQSVQIKFCSNRSER